MIAIYLPQVNYDKKKTRLGYDEFKVARMREQGDVSAETSVLFSFFPSFYFRLRFSFKL